MKPFTPLFQAVIAFTAVMTGLGFIFNLLLAPVKKDLAKLDSRVGRLEVRMDQLENGLKLVQADVSEIKKLLQQRQ